ncbi:MAG TPA: TonB-dependent receptor [Kofleriaceae bacterium]|nr:TonB-dependent receptor [Kofleriaceae bacterium]
MTIALALLGAERAHAEPDATADASAGDEVIVVTGLRLPRPQADSPAAVNVIDRDQLDHAAPALADDVVRLAPNVGTFRRSSSAIADPTSQGLNLRGVGPSGVSRALVLRDGIPLNDPFGGWVYWRAISTLGLQQIEVVPSGASALFGDFALGGVLQMISRPIDDRLAIDAEAAGGSLGTERFAARAADRVGSVGVELTAAGLHSDGYTPIAAAARGAIDGDANSSDTSGGIRIEHTGGESQQRAGVHAFRESLDAGTRFTTADVKTVTYDAGWRWTPGAGTLDAQVFGGVQRFDQERARVTPGRATAASAATQHTPSNNQGGSVTWAGALADGQSIVVGVDGQRVAGTANDHLTPATVMATTLVGRAAGGEQRFAGAFAEDTLRLGPAVELAAALRLDGWQNVAARQTLTTGDGHAMTTPFKDASELQLDPRLGALVHVSPELAVRGSAYRAFRAPTLNELYRPFQVGNVLTAANDQLKPETLWGGELGTQVSLPGMFFEATGFWNRMDDAISNVTLAAPLNGATRQRQNLGQTRIFGLDLDLAWRPSEAWTVRIAHTFTDGKVSKAPAQPDLVGNRLAQDPRNRTTATLTFHDPRIATLMASAQYLDRMFEDDQNTLPIGAVVLVDVRAERALAGGFAVFATGENLFDRRYLVGRAGVDTVGAPRTFEIGLAYHLAGAR